MFAAEFLVVILAMIIGARWGGIFFGMAGGMGLAVLVYGFGLAPSNPPINVMLIMTAVVLAAATLQTAGGMDVLVRVAERMLKRDPKHIVFFAPLIAWLFTFMAGTGNVLYNLLPVISEVSRETGIRPNDRFRFPLLPLSMRCLQARFPRRRLRWSLSSLLSV